MNSDSSDFKKQTHFDDFYFHIFVLSSILTYLNKSDFQKYFRKSRKKPIINKIEHFKIKVMKTIKFSFFFKVVCLKLKIFCFLSLVLSSVCYSDDDLKDTTVDKGLKPVSIFQKDQRHQDATGLRDNLMKADFIHLTSSVLHRGNFQKTHESNPVNKIFHEECADINFSSKIDDFTAYINNINESHEVIWGNGFSRTEMNTQLPERLRTLPVEIDEVIKKCVDTIYKNYAELSHKFADEINNAYYLKLDKPEKFVVLLEKKRFAKDIINFRLNNESSENFKTIQKEIKNYIQFEKKCIDSISSLHGTWLEDRHFISRDRYTELKTKFNNLDQEFGRKRCKGWHEYFTNFTNATNQGIFEKFIDLPKTSCKSMDSLKNSINKDCRQTVNRLNPPFPTKENKEDNLFYQCKTEIDQAYIKCFGKEGERDDKQLTLYLIDQKSPAVCEENRLAKVNPAKQNCIQAVNQCITKCNGTIDTFKTEFLQCFFLPDFNSYTILHKAEINKCSDRIEYLNEAFKKQAKKAPFEAKKTSLYSLDHPNNSSSSAAYHIIGTCENVLKSRQIDKKIAEMQTECQQNPQQENQEENQLIDPATASHSPSGSSGSRNPTSSSSKGGSETGSVPFSYESNNKGFDFNNNLQTEEEQKNSSADPYQMPSLDSNKPPSPNNESDKDSISADFESNGDNSKSSNPYSSTQSSSPRRSVSSTGYAPSLGADSLSADTANTTKERSKTLGTNIRRFLSSDEQYGIINDSPYPQSASQRFLGWMNNKTRKAKKALLNTYDGIVGIDRAEFQRRLQLNNETVNLFELQKEMFIEVCKTHNCDGAGASPEIQNQIRQQQLKRNPSSQ